MACDADAALDVLAASAPFDLVLIDVTMPGRSGWELLESMRAKGRAEAAIFLTAHGQLEDRIRGLRLGADDYVVKPFEFEELVARMEAVLRRGRPRRHYAVGPLTVDIDGRRLTRDGREVELSRREFDVLAVLVEAEGRTLTRAEILDRAFGVRFDPGTNVVDVVVMRLRKKLDVGGGHAIRTVVGEGYMVRAERIEP